jgi:PAS domain S-box-containing protein
MSEPSSGPHALGSDDVFRLVLDAAPDAMVVVDAEGTICYANQQAEHLLGYARSELEGRVIDDLVPERFRKPHRSHRGAFYEKPATRAMGAGAALWARHKDGSELPVEISLSPVRSAGGLLVAAAIRDVTLRRKTELAAQHLAAIVESSEDAIISETLDSVVTSWNPAAARMFGYRADEVVGKTLDILLPPGRKHEELDLLARIARRERVGHFETQRLTKDGRSIDVAVTISQIHDFDGNIVGASKVVRDITERKRVELDARKTHERLASAIESIQGAVALFDAQDRLVMCNSTYRLWFGASTSGIAGRSFAEILDGAVRAGVFDTSQEPAEAYRERILAYHRDPVGALELRTQEGQKLRMLTRRTLEEGTIAIILDITGDVQREEELRRTRAVAESASQAKTEFLSSMSHELRTPLNAILGFAQLLQRDKKTPLGGKQVERVAHILRAGEHLLRLVEDVLDLARIEAGRITISMEPVDVQELVAEVESTLRPMAERSGITLRIEPLPADLPRVAADRTRLSQILMNFSSNAIKYGKGGGLVSISAQRRGERVRITVQDNGIGIPADKQDKLFQPFHRAGQETGPIQGTGIGLTISKRLAEMMRGGVGFRSQEGEGSEFWIELGVDTSAPAPPSSKKGAESVRSSQSARQLVLYVEDNPSNIALMEDILNDIESIELLTAPTAEIGIEVARARRPDIIIMDINLPGMSGTEAAKRLRTWPETRGIPVVALTAAAMVRDARAISEAGIGRVLTKPVQIDELLATLNEYLKPQSKS